jgi:hypothetical protein
MYHYHVSQENPPFHPGASTSIRSLDAQRLAHHVTIITALIAQEPQALHLLLLPQCAVILHPSLPPPLYLLPH